MRRLLTGGLVGFWWIGLTLVACGNDSSSSSNNTKPDGATGTTTPPSSNGDGAVGLTISAADVTVYTGTTAALDASGTSATSFAWSVTSAPTGSAVTTASLAQASTARPTFVADITGDYVLELSASGATGTAKKTVRVKAVAAPIFFMQTNFNEVPTFFEFRAIGNDKSGNHPIACRISSNMDGGPDSQFVSLSLIFADTSLDWWEAPPGSASRVAFGTYLPNPDGGAADFSLSLGNSDSTCQNPPASVRRVPEDGGGAPSQIAILQPRFSPDGARVAYVEQRNAGYVVAAVSFDGNDRRDIAPFCANGDTSCSVPAIFPTRPQWLDAQTLGWARTTTLDGGAAGWEVVVANDSANPQPHVYMTCPGGGAPRSIAFLNDGSVVANPIDATTSIEDLKVFKPSTPGGSCTVVANLTNLPTQRSYARDFSISPDQTQIAFVRQEETDAAAPDGGSTRFGGLLYLAPINGSSPAAPLDGKDQMALFGPRYVASASQLSWNGIVVEDGGSGGIVEAGAPSINVAPLSGGGTTSLVVSDQEGGIYVIGGGNGGSCDFNLCSFGTGHATGGGALATALGAIALAFRRRRRAS